MNQGEYDPARHSPYRSRPPVSPQYLGGAQPPVYGNAAPPQPPGWPHQQQANYWPGQQQPLQGSGMGAASFILALIAGFLLIGCVVVAAIMAESSGGELDEESPAAIAAGLGIILGLVMNLVGLVLGICAVIQRNRKKGLAITGLILNAVLLVGLGGLMLLGLAQE